MTIESKPYEYGDETFTLRRSGNSITVISPRGTSTVIRKEGATFQLVDNETIFNDDVKQIVDSACDHILNQETRDSEGDDKLDDFFNSL